MTNVQKWFYAFDLPNFTVCSAVWWRTEAEARAAAEQVVARITNAGEIRVWRDDFGKAGVTSR